MAMEEIELKLHEDYAFEGDDNTEDVLVAKKKRAMRVLMLPTLPVESYAGLPLQFERGHITL